MRASANMESPPVRSDLRFMVAIRPFEKSLTLGYEIIVSISLRGVQETVLFRVHSNADSVSSPNHNRAILHPPSIRFYMGERFADSSQRRRVWTGSHNATACTLRRPRSAELPGPAACHSILRRVRVLALFRYAMHVALGPNRRGHAA